MSKHISDMELLRARDRLINEGLIADLLRAHRDQIGFLDALSAVDDRLKELTNRK